MQLSAEQLASITAALSATVKKPDPSERRRSPRVGLRAGAKASVAISPIIDGLVGGSYMLELHDISSRGIAVLNASQMPADQQLVLKLPRRGTSEVTILCTVKYSRPGPDRLWTIGAEFTCTINDAAKNPPVKSPAATSAAEDELARIRQSVMG